jgi:hypothetical protein
MDKPKDATSEHHTNADHPDTENFTQRKAPAHDRLLRPGVCVVKARPLWTPEHKNYLIRARSGVMSNNKYADKHPL